MMPNVAARATVRKAPTGGAEAMRPQRLVGLVGIEPRTNGLCDGLVPTAIRAALPQVVRAHSAGASAPAVRAPSAIRTPSHLRFPGSLILPQRPCCQPQTPLAGSGRPLPAGQESSAADSERTTGQSIRRQRPHGFPIRPKPVVESVPNRAHSLHMPMSPDAEHSRHWRTPQVGGRLVDCNYDLPDSRAKEAR